jgi:uncharacterized damage-inducible protein DinB
MISITPDNASFLLQYMLPAVKNEHRITRSVIEAIPQSNADYRPDPHAKNAMEIAWHIAASEERFYSAIADGAFDFSPIPRPESVQTPAQVGQWYGESFDKNFERFPNLSGEHLAKILDFRGIFQLPAVSWFSFSLNHSIHHRGQLSTYLRAMGGKVPAIYGQSYDSEAAKKSAQA